MRFGKLSFAIFPLILAGFIIFGCSSRNPVIPDKETQPLVLTPQNGSSVHNLQGYYIISVDSTGYAEILPVRSSDSHWNIVKFLEKGKCTDCVKIKQAILQPDNSLSVVIAITNPFKNPIVTGFDVRGIVMFNGSHHFSWAGLTISDSEMGAAELLNADGYTALYNPSTASHAPFEGYLKGKFATKDPPNATLNAYKRFVSKGAENTRNAFYAGDTIEAEYKIKMPKSTFVFGYAIDSSWIEPTTIPVTNPMIDFPSSANCPEPWEVDASVLSTFNPDGGTAIMSIDVYDRSGKESHNPPKIECSEIFDGEKTASFVEDLDGGSRWAVEFENELWAKPGNYRALVSVDDSAQDPLKPWMDIRACALSTIEIPGGPLNPIDVTPPELGEFDADLMCWNGDNILAAHNGDIYFLKITSLSYPYIRNRISFPMHIDAMRAYNGYALIISGGYLHIADIDPPESASIINTIETTGIANDIDINPDGKYAFIADGDAGLMIYNIQNVNMVFLVGQVMTYGYARDVRLTTDFVIVGSQRYVTEGSEQHLCLYAESIKVVNPVVPEYCDYIQIGGSTSGSSSIMHSSLDVSENRIIFSTNMAYEPWPYLFSHFFRLYTFDADGKFQYKGEYSTDEGTSIISTVCGNGYVYALISNSDGKGLMVYDIETNGYLYHLYTLDGFYGPYSDGQYPVMLANFQDNLIYALGQEKGTCMIVYDLNNLWPKPILVKEHWPPYLHSLEFYGDYLYGGGAYTDFAVFDVTPAEETTCVNGLNIYNCNSIRDIRFQGDYAYVNGYNLFGILDVSEPADPVFLTSITSTSDIYDIDVKDNYAFLARGGTGLDVFKVDLPDQITFEKTIPTTYGAASVRVVQTGEMVYRCSET